jgi:hypothetical protein
MAKSFYSIRRWAGKRLYRSLTFRQKMATPCVQPGKGTHLVPNAGMSDLLAHKRQTIHYFVYKVLVWIIAEALSGHEVDYFRH